LDLVFVLRAKRISGSLCGRWISR